MSMFETIKAAFFAKLKQLDPRAHAQAQIDALKQANSSRSAWFLGQRTNPRKNAQRQVKRQIGAWQYRKQVKALRRASMAQS